MGRPRSNSGKREEWYEALMETASTPQRKFDILRGRLAADVKRLPENLRPGAYEEASRALEGVIDAIGDALADAGVSA